MHDSLLRYRNVRLLIQPGKILKEFQSLAILFGGRRSSVVPLVYESFNWQHGTFVGASVSSETTAAAAGEVGKLRHDPFAMLPFCGYNMGDYFAHWLSIGERADPAKLPRIYYVNWFRKGPYGEWLWPGFGENSRVLEWVFERTAGRAKAQKTAIGYLPTEDSFDMKGLNLAPGALDDLLSIDESAWLKEVEELKSYFTMFGDRLPKGIQQELQDLEIEKGQRLKGNKTVFFNAPLGLDIYGGATEAPP